MGGVKLPRHPDALAEQLGLLREFLHLCATGQDQLLQQPGHLQGQQLAFFRQYPYGRNVDIAGREPGFPHGPGDPSRVKAFSLGRRQHRLAAFQIHLHVADAIQASQGFFSPVGSEGSRHPVDTDLRTFHLGHDDCRGGKAEGANCRHEPHRPFDAMTHSVLLATASSL